ncbi:MAG TPA: outer membrane beta-barrel family protein [Chitinophagaceae bacterium]|nr:outer membrane beta-barrel family protein [Chitinophagaceae bacterium]
MKKILTSLTLMMTCFVFTVFAQSQSTHIKGQVGDGAKAIEAATISLLNSKDSSLAKVQVTTKTGNFSFENIRNGKYLVMVSAVGYSRYYSPVFELNESNSTVDLKTIALKIQSKDLAAVTVSVTKPMVEQKIDRTILNVEAAVTNVGASALEVLEKAPGVQVDKDGNISLKGKQGVIIMLDGRPAYLTGPELANMLRGMQASQLEQIEIMTNPPAKYDAAGNSGIINIKTKKNKIKGFNGNLTAGIGQGVYFKTNESVNMNYRNGKVNIFGTYSFARNNNFQQLDIYRRFKNEDKTTNAIFEQSGFMKNRRTNNNLKLGMDYYLSKKTTVGVVLSGFYNPGSTLVDNLSYLKSPLGVVDSIVTADNHTKELWKNASVNLNLRHQFDSTGREITVDLDHIVYDATSDQNFVNTTYGQNWVKKYAEELSGDLPVTINISSARVDYTHPLGKETKLEAGFKTSFVNNNSKANYYLDHEQEIPDYTKTFFFDYKENINAAYINLNRQINKKWGVQAGLRFENTNYSGFQHGNPLYADSSFSNSYNNLFPTMYISYSANKSNQFGLSFGRRIDRPAYQDLNPFMFFIDKYTYGSGNPWLKPQYSNNIEFTHIFKGKLTTTLNYGETTNFMTETFDQEQKPNGEDGYATIVREGNLGKRQNGGIAVSAQIPIAKWFNTMIYTNYNYNRFTGIVHGEYLETEAANLMLNVNNQFKFKKGWSAEVSGWYRTKGVEGQILIKPMGMLAFGVSKQVLKGKGSVRLNVRDVLYTQMPKGEINFESTEARFKNSRDSRVANITFTYRFGKPINGNSQRKKASAAEEQNRVKAGE